MVSFSWAAMLARTANIVWPIGEDVSMGSVTERKAMSISCSWFTVVTA